MIRSQVGLASQSSGRCPSTLPQAIWMASSAEAACTDAISFPLSNTSYRSRMTDPPPEEFKISQFDSFLDRESTASEERGSR